MIKLTQEAIDAGNDGCTAGGHDGQLYSKCWISCDDGYDMIIKEEDPVVPEGHLEEYKNQKNVIEIRCKQSGNWKPVNPF